VLEQDEHVADLASAPRRDQSPLKLPRLAVLDQARADKGDGPNPLSPFPEGKGGRRLGTLSWRGRLGVSAPVSLYLLERVGVRAISTLLLPHRRG
jgi:hypothetical protein